MAAGAPVVALWGIHKPSPSQHVRWRYPLRLLRKVPPSLRACVGAFVTPQVEALCVALEAATERVHLLAGPGATLGAVAAETGNQITYDAR